MVQKFKRYALAIMAGLTLMAPGLVTILGSSASADVSNSLCTGIQIGEANGCAGTSTDSTSTVSGIAREIINVFSIVVGAAAVIMIIYGGFRYITSGGDSNKVGSAKNALVYAIVGLIIVALAQVIIKFVLTEANNQTTNLAT